MAVLSDARIRALKPKGKPYKQSDFDGLYLLVNPSGSKLWRFKYRWLKKEKLLALGKYPDVSLAEARCELEVALRDAEAPVTEIQAAFEGGLEALEAAVDGGFSDRASFVNTAAFVHLRSDPRFGAQRVRLHRGACQPRDVDRRGL